MNQKKQRGFNISSLPGFDAAWNGWFSRNVGNKNQSTLRNILEERRSHLQPAGSLKSRTSYLIGYLVNLACTN
jgi:hypothetical protein